MCPSRRVLPPAFPQMRLDNTIQVLPAPPFRKIKRNYVADRGTSPVPDGQIISLDLLKRVLPLAFPQMRLDNTIQVLPAPPFRKIKRNYVADRGTSPVPDGQIISLDLLKRVLPLAFPQMRLDNTIQVLPAPPFRKIKRNYVADRGISPAPTGKSFRFLCLGASFRLLFRKCVLIIPTGITCAAFSQNQTKSHRR